MQLIQGNCLEVMKDIPSGSVDMVLTDPPYGTTACKWDSVIHLDRMWRQLERVIKPNGAIVMTASQPFTTTLIASNFPMHKYNLVWRKTKVGHFAQAPYRFLTEHEDISVFSFGGTAKNALNLMAYYPQGLKDTHVVTKARKACELRPNRADRPDYVQSKTGYPKSILSFPSVSGKQLHPTQKPVELMEYLLKTYTIAGETVLDFAMGSGTTGVACKNLGREFIGIELDPVYFEVARSRIRTSPAKLF